MRRRRSWLPDFPQELLLELALAQDRQHAERSWRKWRSTVELERIDRSSFELLPLAYRNLIKLGIEDEELPRLRGVYLLNWSRNQLLMKTGAAALRDLSGAGIETIVLKGAALSVQHYADFGVRTAYDFDILVPRERALDAMEALSSLQHQPPSTPPQEWIPVRHSMAYHDASGREIDLHWYSLWHSAPDHDFWEAAVPAEIGGARTRVLCPADQLLHVCSHGAWWTPTGQLRWIPDAVTVIRGSEVDWERVCDQARSRRVANMLIAPLDYVRERFGAPVPEWVRTELTRAPASLLERSARRAGRAPSNPARTFVWHFERYRRMKRMDPEAEQPQNFPSTFRNLNGCESYLDLAMLGGRRLLGIGRGLRAQQGLR